MGELTIRRNRGFAPPVRQESVKASKQAASSTQVQKAAKETGDTVSETMRRQMGAQAENQVRESRRSLQAGEAVLAEIQGSLSRMAELAKKAAEGGEAGRDALQAELEQLQESISRMVNSAFTGSVQLFTDGEPVLPDWLAQGVTLEGVTAEALLTALGLDQNASGVDLLRAIASRPMGGNTAAGYLASMYLGAVIAGGGTENLDPREALDGLRQLLEKVAEGVPMDEAVKELTNGEFTSVEDFQDQFFQGKAPGMEEFLKELLLTEAAAAIPAMPDISLIDFLAGMEGMNFDLLMGLLDGGAGGELDPALLSVPLEGGGEAQAAQTAQAAAPELSAPVPEASVEYGNMQITGRDLSGVSFDASTGIVTVSGTADAAIRSLSPEPQALQITGSGTVTLADVNASAVTVNTPEAHINSAGRSQLAAIQLQEGASVTLGGEGFLRVEAFHGNHTNTLRLTGGAVAVGREGGPPSALRIPVILEGPASLAAQAVHVHNAAGKPMEPMDVVWKALFPGFHSISLLELNGKQAKMALLGSPHADQARLWMEKGDPSGHGSPLYALMIQGKDQLGRTKTRYTYLYWNHQTRRFEEGSRYPNPFTVTGGEAGLDWVYEEGTCTLHILSGQVTAISGGQGTSKDQEPFSGRIVLADSIGAMELALGGVVCRVDSGRSFYLGRENEITLFLEDGSSNLFESGAGYAGISLGEGTSLRIDCGASGGKAPAGTLTATGGEGSAGIGRDSGSRERIGPVLLRGGSGQGAKELGDMRSITIAGGSVTANGKKRTPKEHRWMQRSVSLQMGEYTAILPQFRLSSHVLQLNKLRVSTREYARAAMMTIDEDRHWISQIQAAYSSLYSQLDGPVRDAASAGTLLEDVRQSIPRQSAQALRSSGQRGRENLRELLRR